MRRFDSDPRLIFLFLKEKLMHLSKIALSLKSSPTLKLNELANRLKSEGKDIVHLGGGEPEFDIPQRAKELSIEKLNSNRVRYTPTSGIKALKEKIITYIKEIYDFDVSIDNIVVSSGAKQSIYNFLVAVVDPGDEVLIFAPYWVSYPEMVSMTLANPVIVKPSDGLIPSFDDFKKHITSNTKLVIINNPSNPTGLIYPNELVEKIVSYCIDRNIYLLFDSIYDQLVLDDVYIKSPFFYINSLEEGNICVVNGFSKSFAMTGFRIGFSISSKAVAKAMSNIQAQITSCPSELSQIASLGALEEGKNFTKKLVEDLRLKRDVIVEELSRIPNIKFSKPLATFYSFVDFSYYDKSSSNLSKALIEKAGVVTVPGIEFGMDGYLRISFCSSIDDIKKGIRRIGEFLKNYGGSK